MDGSIPCLLVHHQLPELAQTHVHWISDAIQPSHPLSSPYPPAFNLFQYQGLFQWVSSLYQVAKVSALEWSFSFCISPSREYSGVINQNSEDKSQQYGKWDFHFGSVLLGKDTGVLPLLAVWEQRNNSIQEYPSFTWFPVYCLTIICCNRQ